MGADFSTLLSQIAAQQQPPPPPPPPPIQLPADPTGVKEYGRIQSEYATYSNQIISDEIRKTRQSLKPLRAKTAPAEDLEMERRKITLDAQQSLFLVQLALFLVFLSLVSFVVLPQSWAGGITFLLLCVGIGSGFFLRR
jgi:hypothetical protein